MVAADIRAAVLAEASNGIFGSNNKLAGDEVSELALFPEHLVRGLSGDGRVNLCDGQPVNPLLDPEISLSVRYR